MSKNLRRNRIFMYFKKRYIFFKTLINYKQKITWLWRNPSEGTLTTQLRLKLLIMRHLNGKHPLIWFIEKSTLTLSYFYEITKHQYNHEKISIGNTMQTKIDGQSTKYSYFALGRIILLLAFILKCKYEKWKWSRSVVSESLWPHGL